MSSPAQVFDTYELLERILLHLPIHDLFTMQRVSPHWQGVTQRSIPLRKRMFLMADGPVQLPEPRREIDDEDEEYYYEEAYSSCSPIYLDRMRLNPAFQLWCGRHDFNGDDFNDACSLELPGRLRFLFGSCSQSFREMNISLRIGRDSSHGMLLTQPPITEVRLQMVPVERFQPTTDICTIYNPTGITVGNIYNSYFKHASKYGYALGPMPEGFSGDYCTISFHLTEIDDLPDEDIEDHRICTGCDYINRGEDSGDITLEGYSQTTRILRMTWPEWFPLGPWEDEMRRMEENLARTGKLGDETDDRGPNYFVSTR